MRRQTFLLAAALAVTAPNAALTESRTAARDTARAIDSPESATAPDRLILKTEDATTAASSLAPVDEAALLFELAEAHKLRQAVAGEAAPRLDMRTNARAPAGADAAPTASPAATAGGADAVAETRGFTAHHGLSPADAFPEQRNRVSLELAPVTAPTHRDGDRPTPHPDDAPHGADVSGVAVGLSFKLN